MTDNRSILLIGCGKMGQAMLNAWMEQGIIEHASVVDPHLDSNAIEDSSVKIYQELSSLPPSATFDMMILAIKPQIMDSVLDTIKGHLDILPPIMSIAAGKSIANMASVLNAEHPIIRVMPNTPAAIGKGMSVAIANAFVSDDQKSFANALLKSCGLAEWVDDETMLNAVTALSGSGPAYIFHLIETLENAGVEIGLPDNLAKTLARQTVIGAAALAEHDLATPASTLRENVTSKNGTTAAALDVLMNGDIQNIYNTALTAAKTRGEELGS
jgi:pyrroline-5-carboxylate reductase